MLKGKVAVVTGGGKGIGKSISLKLAEQGATVFVVQRSTLSSDLSQFKNVHWIRANLAMLESAEYISDVVSQKHDSIDILVNNAGIMLEKKLEDMELDDWQNMLMLNTTFPLFLIKSFLTLLKKNKGSSIINIGSIEGISANPEHVAYCTTKAAIHGMTRALAVDLGDYGIRCNAIAPGWINTDINHNLIKNTSDPCDFNEKLKQLHPVGRTGESDDIAKMVNFLASDDSSFITGQVIIIDGGRTAKLPMP